MFENGRGSFECGEIKNMEGSGSLHYALAAHYLSRAETFFSPLLLWQTCRKLNVLCGYTAERGAAARSNTVKNNLVEFYFRSLFSNFGNALL